MGGSIEVGIADIVALRIQSKHFTSEKEVRQEASLVMFCVVALPDLYMVPVN